MTKKLVIIAPGYKTFPPNGWGAVESIVWDYYENLLKKKDLYNITVEIVNQQNLVRIIHECNSHNPDFIHIMFDDYIHVVPYLKCANIFYTSHYAYLTNGKADYKYFNILNSVIEFQDRITINAISRDIENVYRQIGFQGNINIICNGAREDLFEFTLEPKKGDRSAYVAKIEMRKAQYKYQFIPGIDFIGNYHNSPFDRNLNSYLGEWDKPELYQNLTHYANLVLLSEAEADPLVIKEALIAGLGLVISECSTANLDLNKEFISVVPNNRLNDLEYVDMVIKRNRLISIQMRKEIREYGISNFSWNKIVERYNAICLNAKKKTIENRNDIMKIALIAPGIMEIPAKGWGAVELLIWDYYLELTRRGHEVDIINKIRLNGAEQGDIQSLYCQDLIHTINSKPYDFVHIHFDVLYHIMPYLRCQKVAITSHYPYIDQLEKHHADGFRNVFLGICNDVCDFPSNHIFAVSKKDCNAFSKFTYDKSKIHLCLNGANHKEIILKEGNKMYPDKSIYVGKIEARKNQHKYNSLPDVDFYGKCEDKTFGELPCFKGEKEHNDMITIMSEYGNLVLLSDGENGTPLVIKEALMCGLPVVTSSRCIDDIDVSLPFIDIIPDNKLDDLDYIGHIIKENLKKQGLQKEIRKYAEENFAWEVLVDEYIKTIQGL